MKPLRPAPGGTSLVEHGESPAAGHEPPPTLITGVTGPATARDRELWGMLLHTVWPEPGKARS